MIVEYDGMSPSIAEGVYVAETAYISGKVIISRNVSIWPSVVIRGDVNKVFIDEGTNIQDGCVVHVTGEPSYPVYIGKEVTIGHNATIHGATINDRVLIGMGAVVLDGAVISKESMVAAGALVVPGFVVPEHTLVAGVPAKIKRNLTDKEIEYLKISALKYQELARKYMK